MSSAVTPTMPQGVQDISFVHRFPLHVVTRCFWGKFPSPEVPDVLKVEMVSDYTDEQNRRHRHRRITARNAAPWVVRKLLATPTLIFQERSVMDPARGVLELRSENVTYSSIIKGTEVSQFSIHEDNPGWTLFHQSGEVSATAMFGPLRGFIERFGARFFHKHGKMAIRMLDDELVDKHGDGKEAARGYFIGDGKPIVHAHDEADASSNAVRE